MDVTTNKKSYIIHRSMGYGNLWLLEAELLGIKCMGAPRETSELKKVYDITSGSLLGENSSIDLTVKKVFFSCDANAICCIVLMDFIIYDSVCTSRRKMALSTIFYSLFGKYSHTISSYTNYLLAALWIIFHLPVTD